ncbi:MAG TPA: M43 family zinc metalloprotease [Hanamia sp.]|nr:M43 family zinc metalloprotease [Hanamia sp.]
MKIILTLLCFCFFYGASAQRCGTPEYMTSHPIISNNALRTVSQDTSTRDTLPNEVIVVPVVVHILYNTNDQNISDVQVLSQIVSLNNDYRRMNADTVNTPAPFKSVAADTRIQFCLAKVDPQGRSTTGIIRKFTSTTQFIPNDDMKFSSKGGDDAWDATKYLNIWVCNLFGQTLGYAVMPGGPPANDGVVVCYDAFGTIGNVIAPYNKGRTLTHEIGHWLGLRHLWGDAYCGDDGIADTPPQETSNSFCPTFPHLSSCSINSYGDMFMDYMDFTDDGCMNMFTQDQKAEMRSLFALGNVRNSFLNSSVCDSSNAEEGPLPVKTAAPSVLEITTYPNPFINTITIASNDEASVVGKVLRLYNIEGKLFLTQIIQSQNTVLDLSRLPSGMYILKIQSTDNSLVYKIIKQSGGGSVK